jgi:hypothetical protein
VFANAVAELEVLVKHRTEGEGNRLQNVRQTTRNSAGLLTLRNMYEVGGGVGTLGESP